MVNENVHILTPAMSNQINFKIQILIWVFDYLNANCSVIRCKLPKDQFWIPKTFGGLERSQQIRFASTRVHTRYNYVQYPLDRCRTDHSDGVPPQRRNRNHDIHRKKSSSSANTTTVPGINSHILFIHMNTLLFPFPLPLLSQCVLLLFTLPNNLFHLPPILSLHFSIYRHIPASSDHALPGTFTTSRPPTAHPHLRIEMVTVTLIFSCFRYTRLQVVTMFI